ncbi:MAG: right-handed parallel beta-helix repeat-containing protein, partial [Chitinivibrionales bacterium]|nr:right-handed parallel beta-helix repeat-containing protein [Chitinivibrionales bacterium]
VKWSGSGAAAQITYDGNSAGKWGVGKAIIDGENLRSYGFIGPSGPVAYVTINNFEIRNLMYTGVAWAGGTGVKIDDATNVTVANCYLHDIGYWKNDGSIVPAGSGTCMARPKNCVITGCEVTKTGLGGIVVDGAVNCTISHNNIHDYITWGIDVGGDYNLCTGNIICDNTIHDLYQYDAGYYGGAGDPPHTDYIFIRMGAGQHPVKNIVERNLLYNNQVFDEFGGTAMLFLSYADSTIVRNNIFINPHEYFTARFDWTSSGTKFYNNTIYAPGKITASGGASGILLVTNGNSDIRNNIIVSYQSSIALTAAVDESGLTSNYNLFYNVTGAQDFVRITPARYTAFTQWVALGYDTHSLHAASVASIGFVNTAGYPTACQTMDLRLLPTSPAVDAGTTIAGFSDDFKLCSRPKGAAWDIGTFEYNPADPPPRTAVVPGVGGPTQAHTPEGFKISAQAAGTSASLVRINFSVPVPCAEIRFELFDLQGRTLRSEIRRSVSPGNYTLTFSGGSPRLSRGNYLCRMRTNGFDKSVVLAIVDGV